MSLKLVEGATGTARVVVVDKGGAEIAGAALPTDLAVAPADASIATDTLDSATGAITIVAGNVVGGTQLIATGGGFASAPYQVDVTPAAAGLAILDA